MEIKNKEVEVIKGLVEDLKIKTLSKEDVNDLKSLIYNLKNYLQAAEETLVNINSSLKKRGRKNQKRVEEQKEYEYKITELKTYIPILESYVEEIINSH